LATIECGYRSRDELVREGPALSIILSNRSATIPLSKQIPALIDTGSDWNLIESAIAATTLHMMHIDNRSIQTANGITMAPVYLGQLIIPGLNYSRLHRFIAAELGAERAILGREVLRDFVLTYSGKSGRVTLEF
jgi:predicted aspartyl protease